MVLTMAAVADHKQITVQTLEVQVTPQAEGEGRDEQTCFRSAIRLGPGLTPRERRLLFNAARTCEVHKMLSRPVLFAETLLDE